MERLIKTLNSVNSDSIKQEVVGQKIKSSSTLNIALKTAYPVLKGNSSKLLLLKIWTLIITNAANPREGNISRIWMRLFESLDRIIKALFENESTIETLLTSFRKPIKTKFGPDSEIYKQSIYTMGVSRERSIQRKEEYSTKVKVRNATRAKLEPIYVEDILNVIQKLKKSPNPYERSIAVLLATGSRSIELFKVSKYIIESDPNYITIKGIAKDKGNNTLSEVIIKRPLVGLKSKEVVELVSEIREDLDLKGSNSKITNITNTQLNKAFQQTIQPLASEFKMSSHKCRYIYGNVAYLLYGKSEKIPYESFITEILGHLSGESTKSYLGINIQFREKVINSATPDIQVLFQKEIKDIRNQIEQRCPSKKIDLDFTEEKNSFRRTMNNEEKINSVVGALQKIKDAKTKINQRELRSELGYSATVMTAGYQLAREKGII